MPRPTPLAFPVISPSNPYVDSDPPPPVEVEWDEDDVIRHPEDEEPFVAQSVIPGLWTPAWPGQPQPIPTLPPRAPDDYYNPDSPSRGPLEVWNRYDGRWYDLADRGRAPSDHEWSPWHNRWIPINHAIYVYGPNCYMDRRDMAGVETTACAEGGRIHLTAMRDRAMFMRWDGRWVEQRYIDRYVQRDGQFVLKPVSIMAGYHGGIREKDNVTPSNPFLIGFEIEKEDGPIRKKYQYQEKPLPQGWAMERDGSLSDTVGFEIVTRAYNLRNAEKMKQDFKSVSDLLAARHTRKCGGHINISDMRFCNVDEEERSLPFADRIKPLFPLMMALYPHRLANSYVRCSKFSELCEHGEGDGHYKPFVFKRGRIEIRIPSAVRNMKNLLWRAELIMLVLKQSKNAPVSWAWMRAECAKGGRIRRMLEEVYCKHGDPDKDPAGASRVREKLFMYGAFARFFFSNAPVDESIRQYLQWVPGITGARSEEALLRNVGQEF